MGYSSVKVFIFLLGSLFLFEEGTDVILSISPLSDVYGIKVYSCDFFFDFLTKLQLPFWLRNTCFTQYFLFFIFFTHTQVRRRSITANMNQFDFLAACEDIFTFGLSLITCKGSRPYNLSKICVQLQTWFGKDHFLLCHPRLPQTFTEQTFH